MTYTTNVRILAILLVFLQAYSLSASQAAPLPPLTAASQKIKEAVGTIAIGDKLTIRKIDGTEYHGRLAATDSRTFSIHEVDLGTTLTIPYDDVDRVRKNYGGKGIGGRRVDPKRNLIAGIIFLGGLLIAVIVLVANDKS